MPAAAHLCTCRAPLGAGATPTVQVMTPQELLDRPEASYPIGSQARLFAPFPADRGIWEQPRLVSLFVKTPNGRWTSYPGNDVNYPTLAALALAVPVESVSTPGLGLGAPSALPPISQAEAAAADASQAEAAAAEIEMFPATGPAYTGTTPAPAAPRFNPLWLAAAAGLALVFFWRR